MGHLQSLVAPDHGDDEGEDRRLDDADPERPNRVRSDELAGELEERYVENGGRHHGAAQESHDIGIEGEQRQHQDQSQDPGQHQHFHRIEAHGAHGVDFLVHLHGTDLRRKGGTGSAGHDNGGQQDAHFPQDPDADQVDGKDLRAKAG